MPPLDFGTSLLLVFGLAALCFGILTGWQR